MRVSEMTPIEQESWRVTQNNMINGRTVQFTYLSIEGVESHREAEPYEIKGVTLYAWCLERQAMRQFKLDRMTSLSTGVPFKPRFPVMVPL